MLIGTGGRAHAVAAVTAFEPGYRFASLAEDRDVHYLQLLQPDRVFGARPRCLRKGKNLRRAGNRGAGRA
jgi:hypothetical protein